MDFIALKIVLILLFLLKYLQATTFHNIPIKDWSQIAGSRFKPCDEVVRRHFGFIECFAKNSSLKLFYFNKQDNFINNTQSLRPIITYRERYILNDTNGFNGKNLWKNRTNDGT